MDRPQRFLRLADNFPTESMKPSNDMTIGGSGNFALVRVQLHDGDRSVPELATMSGTHRRFVLRKAHHKLTAPTDWETISRNPGTCRRPSGSSSSESEASEQVYIFALNDLQSFIESEFHLSPNTVPIRKISCNKFFEMTLKKVRDF